MQTDTSSSFPYHPRIGRSESKFQLFAFAKSISSGEQENELVIQEDAMSNFVLKNMHLTVERGFVNYIDNWTHQS